MRLPCREHDPEFWAAWVANNPNADLDGVAEAAKAACSGCHGESEQTCTPPTEGNGE